MTVFKDLAKSIGDDFTSVLTDGKASAEFAGWIDTGSYILNALCSGSIYGGIASNKVTGFAGAEATGKTFFALGLMKSFQLNNPDGGIFLMDTESASSKDMMTSRGVDPDRVIVSEPQSVEQFRTNGMKFLRNYMKMKESERPPMMMVLDSLGNLSTEKEIADIVEGKNTRDMTRTQLIRGAFRAMTLELSRARCPFIVTNHTYQTMDMYSPDQISGGGGLKYAASTIITLSKAQDKEGTDIVGSFITCTTAKSRFTKEKQKVKVKLNYDTGLDRYFGLLDIAEEYGIFERSGNKYLIDGKSQWGKTINENPERFYTEEVLAKIDEAVGKKFKYGGGLDIDSQSTEEVEEEFDEAV